MGLFNRNASKKNKTPSAPPPPQPLPPPPAEPPSPAMKVKSTADTRQVAGSFDADKFAYDVDIKTGLFYAVTFDYFVPRNNDPIVTNVPYSKEVFELIPEGKREIYLEKFGDPAATEETETQKTLNLLLEQVAELTGRPPSQPVAEAPCQQKNTGTRLKIS